MVIQLFLLILLFMQKNIKKNCKNPMSQLYKQIYMSANIMVRNNQ